MSRVRYVPLPPGAPRSTDDLTEILDDIADASNQIGSVNLAEEGMDASAFVNHVAIENIGRIERFGRTAIAPQSWAVLDVDGDVKVVLGGHILEPDHAVRIRAFVQAASTVSDGHGIENVTGKYEFRLAWTVGGTDFVVPCSRRTRAQRAQNPIAPRNGLHLDLMWEGWLFGPAVIQAIAVQYQMLGAGTLRVDSATLEIDEYKRLIVE
jgi:hypothetical protein